MADAEWLDVEAVLIRRLAPAIAARFDGAVEAGTVARLDKQGEFVRVVVSGGEDDGLTDTARVDVDALSMNRQRARALAEAVRGALLSLAGTSEPDGSALIDSVRTIGRPVEVSYRNPDYKRFVVSASVKHRLQ